MDRASLPVAGLIDRFGLVIGSIVPAIMRVAWETDLSHSTTEDTVLSDRNWEKAARQYETSVPFHLVVLDDLLDEPARKRLHEGLLSHYAWKYKNWVNQYLTNNQPEIPEIFDMASQLEERLPTLGGLRLVKHWAIMAHQNVGLIPHADNGAVLVNYWLTPDDCNLDSDTGGMLFYDVSRPEDIFRPEYGIAPDSEEYVKKHTKGVVERVGYSCNRAIAFDGRTFHASEPVNFSGDGPASRRLNLTLVFDDPDAYLKRERRGDQLAEAADANRHPPTH